MRPLEASTCSNGGPGPEDPERQLQLQRFQRLAGWVSPLRLLAVAFVGQTKERAPF